MIAVLSGSIHAQVQTMAIAGGTIARFAEPVSQVLVNAFCIDRGLSTPARDARFSAFSGDVKLTFKDGTAQILDLKNAAQYVQISGTGSYRTVRLEPRTPNLSSIEFLNHSVVTQGTDDQARQSEQLVRESFPEHLAPDSQPDIWHKFLWKKAVEGSGPDTITTLQYRRLDPSHILSQRLINLSTTGDAVVLTLPNERKVLIDTGFAKQDGPRISALLGGRQDIAILTHPDRDHTGNFPQLQDQRGFDDVILSGWASQTAIAQEVDKRLALGYTRTRIAGSPMEMYTFDPANAPPSTTQPGNTVVGGGGGEGEPPISAKHTSFEDDDPDDPSMLNVAIVQADRSVKIQLFQLSNPKSPNEGSIAVRVTHNGYSTLYASDITPKVMRAMADRALASEIDEGAFGDTRLMLRLLHSQYPEEEEELAHKYEKYGADINTWSEDHDSNCDLEPNCLPPPISSWFGYLGTRLGRYVTDRELISARYCHPRELCRNQRSYRGTLS
jgi:hypothetical protein